MWLTHAYEIASTDFTYSKHFLGKGKKTRILVIGAGITGIGAIKLYKETFPNREVELAVYEKNSDVTGTWLENRYPGYVYAILKFLLFQLTAACLVL